MKPLERSDYDDRDDATYRSDVYRELEWVRYHQGWPKGWTAVKFRELFGCWPPRRMEGLTPMPASDALQKWVRCGINKWVREKRKHERGGGQAGIEQKYLEALRRMEVNADYLEELAKWKDELITELWRKKAILNLTGELMPDDDLDKRVEWFKALCEWFRNNRPMG